MRKPQSPPDFSELMNRVREPEVMHRVMKLMQQAPRRFHQYVPWDMLRRRQPPEGASIEDWWLATKLQRRSLLKPISLTDKLGKPFQFCVPDLVQERLHEIDVRAGGTVGVPSPITNPQTRDQYLIRSLMEEAITSSQLEGATTTREAAKEMIRSGRPPRDKDEQMILNNFVTMQRISGLRNEALSPEIVFEIHRLVTEKTLDDESAAGRFRRADEKRIVGDTITDEVYHDPPESSELEGRLRRMCAFANEETPSIFIHPIIRAIILHFWLAYDHPFVDGNGRTARALFYWAMLRKGYWLFEFISISTILKKAQIKYGRSFLYTETDENDLTYFIIAQAKVIRQAIDSLHAYIDRKTLELREMVAHLRALDLFNHRQVAIIRHALKHPFQHYTIESHRTSHGVVYQTARTDLLDLRSRGVLEKKTKGKLMVFSVPPNLTSKLKQLEKKLRK